MLPETSTLVRTGGGASVPPGDDLRSLAAGLDRLQTSADTERSRWRRFVASVVPPIVFVALLIVAWQLFVVIAQPRPDIVPSPADVAAALGDAWASGRLPTAIVTSLERGILGFLISIVVATPIGLLLAEVRPIRRAAGPIISGLQVLPSVAWVPAAILWFGLTDATAYFVVLMGAIPSIVNGLVSGVDQVPPQLRRVGTILGARRFRLATLIVLPAALPGYVAGLKQGWAFAWRSLLAGELLVLIAGKASLGRELDTARQFNDIPALYATMIVILALGIAVDAVFGYAERRIRRRYGLVDAASR